MEPKRIARFEKVSFGQYLKDYRRLNPHKEHVTDDEIKTEWDNIILPKRATVGSAGYDFFMPFTKHLYPDANVLFPTGIRCAMEVGWVLLLAPKSGLGTKYGTRLTNTLGIVDVDYFYSDNEGHILCGMSVSKELTINTGEKFIQGLFVPIGITTDDNVHDYRNGGFGSTGA